MQIGCTHVFPCWPVSCHALSFAINLSELDISCNSGMQSPPAGGECLRRSWKMYCWESFNFLVVPFWSILTFQCIHSKRVWCNSWAENVVSWDISCSNWHAPFMWWQSWIFLRHSVLETNWTITWCSDYTQWWFSACSLSLQPLHFHWINLHNLTYPLSASPVEPIALAQRAFLQRYQIIFSLFNTALPSGYCALIHQVQMKNIICFESFQWILSYT